MRLVLGSLKTGRSLNLPTRILEVSIEALRGFIPWRLHPYDGSGQRMMNFPGGVSGKEPPANEGRHKRRRFNPGVGRSPGGGSPVFTTGRIHWNTLQYYCLENPMHEELGVHRVSELDTTEATQHSWNDGQNVYSQGREGGKEPQIACVQFIQ